MKWFVVLALVMGLAHAALAAAPTWTIALFLNGNNDLDTFLDQDLAELAQGAANPHVRIVAQLARRGQPARRVVFETGGPRTITELGTVDMGDAASLTAFFDWAAKNYPAEHTALVLWDHGSGWDKDRAPALRGISHDEVSGHHITTEALGQALDHCRQTLGRKLDVVAMDACLMQMVEVLFTIGGACDYVVASEEAVPGAGYPYADVIAGLADGTTPEQFAIHWSEAFVAWYRREFGGTNKRATQSAVRTRDLAELFAACDQLSDLLIAGGHAKQVQPCLEQVVKFLTFGRTNVDLGQLTDLLKSRANDAAVTAACDRIHSGLSAVVLTAGSGGAPDLAATQGVAIYFPRKPTSYDAAYGNIPFCRAHSWGRMVWLYFKELGLVWAKREQFPAPDLD